ncbi:NB-ARC domain-containing protein, partial [Oscillatoria sp. CS-180]|uniref:NB-ARC domain-containing protein n=1 Tax=Oscillatoria sp. CS-180 TaxID=3021720 RepID=UPI002330BC46
MSDSLVSQKRVALSQLVSSLLSKDFEELLFALDVPLSTLPSNTASQGARAAALLQWAKGPTGCGLRELLKTLEKIAPQAFKDALGDLNECCRIMSSRVSKPLKSGAPFLAPPLPRHYVPRPEHLTAVKEKLLDEAQPGTLVISAIYGMGGIGKSVLAAALVQEPDVQQRFADGILWVTLGQNPDLLSMVNQWIRELGDYDYNPTTLEAASLHLRTLLADKCALLVVDDVWNPEHVEPFRIGGAGCCVLVTTRQTKIVGATRYDLDLMTPQQSLDLLTQYLPYDLDETEQAQAAVFAKEVGYLPLALELAAAQIEDGVSWTELLEAFRAEMAVLDLDSDVNEIADESIRKQRSLEASFKLTLKLLSPQQLEQFAWLGIVPEDVTLTQEMAATLWQVNSFQAGKLLRELKNRALLLPQAQRIGERPTYRIHDLVHDLAKTLLTQEQSLGDLPGLGLTIEAAHQTFLSHYQVQTQDGLWHTVPDDGYIHRHLPWHFEQAQQPDCLHSLLQERTPEGRNGWYEACESLGQTANFVTDVARAWQWAEESWEQQPQKSIVLQWRYALITTTLNSLASNIPAELIAVFVQKKFWAPAQGLAYIRQAKESHKKAEGIAAISSLLPPALIAEAVSLARDLQSDDSRAFALRALAPHLPEPLFTEALQAARDIQDDYYRARALSALAPHLPESLFTEALQAARDIQKGSDRARALSELAPHLPEPLLTEALQAARDIQSDYSRASALRALAPHLPEPLLTEALQAARDIQDDSYRASALSALAPHLP